MRIDAPPGMAARAHGEWRAQTDTTDGIDPGVDVVDSIALALARRMVEPPRRLGTFARLALLGALVCRAEVAARSIPLPRDCALLLISDTSVWREIAPRIADFNCAGVAPTPFEFLAVQGNSACLAIARCLEIAGPAACCTDPSPAQDALACAFALDAPALLVGRVERRPGEWSSIWDYYSRDDRDANLQSAARRAV
jgi:hypothetical protein